MAARIHPASAATFCARLNEKSSRIYYFRVLPLASVNIWPFGHGVAMQIGRIPSSHCCCSIIYDPHSPPSSLTAFTLLLAPSPGFPRFLFLSFFSLSIAISRTRRGIPGVTWYVGVTPAAIIVRWFLSLAELFALFTRSSGNRSPVTGARTRPSRRSRGCSLIVPIVRCRFRRIFRRDEALLAHCTPVPGGHVACRR